jgi:hypothetical protein
MGHIAAQQFLGRENAIMPDSEAKAAVLARLHSGKSGFSRANCPPIM